MQKAFTFALLMILSCLSLQAQPKPNIVFILADDLGWRDLSCMGSKYYATPNLDRLASQGLLFTDAYAAAPVCTPTRAALMTGKTPARLGITAVFDRDRGEMPLLPPDWPHILLHHEYSLAERLKDAGYVTAHMGKWHLGPTAEYWPEAHGFDVNIAGCHLGRVPTFFSPYQNPRISDGPEGEYLTERLGREAAGFIRQNADTSFFLYLPFYSPHAPLEAPEATIAAFEGKAPDGGQKIPAYAAMIAEMDKAVGQVMAALEDAGVAENTLLVFTSDNGGVKTIWDVEITDNAPLRAEKFLLYEGGIRVPLIVRWPGIAAEGKKTRQLVSTVDFLPTFMAAVGKPVLEPEIDGIDLNPVFRLGDDALINRPLAWHYPHYMPRQDMKPGSALRLGKYKLVHWLEDHRIELFDLQDDIGETRNLAPEMPEKTKQLYRQLEAWRNQSGALMPQPNPVYQDQAQKK
jgi:arylsulfatase A-like enzyme